MTHQSEAKISYSRLRQYQASGVHELLWRAATEVEFRGEVARGVPYDPRDDLVDAYGALCLAAGVHPLRLLAHGDDLTAMVAPAHVPTVLAAIEALEGWFSADLPTWSDKTSAADIATAFRHVAGKIAVATES